MVAGKCASRASRISSAQWVKSFLFFSVSFGSGKVFQPNVFEYLKSVFNFPQTVAIQTRWVREAINAIFQRGGLPTKKARFDTIVPGGR